VSNIQSQKALQNLKTNTKRSQHTDSKGSDDGSLILSQRKVSRERNKTLVNKQSKSLTPKQDSWWATELILEPEANI
jgi:hypothetical protein